MTDPKYGAVVTSDVGYGSVRLMLIAPDTSTARPDRDPWLVCILHDHMGSSMYGGVGRVVTINYVTQPNSAWQEPVS